MGRQPSKKESDLNYDNQIANNAKTRPFKKLKI